MVTAKLQGGRVRDFGWATLSALDRRLWKNALALAPDQESCPSAPTARMRCVAALRSEVFRKRSCSAAPENGNALFRVDPPVSLEEIVWAIGTNSVQNHKVLAAL